MTNFVAPLFVPASRPDRFEKAAASGADAVILDLEDAVAPADKAKARHQLRIDLGGPPVVIRINAIGSAWHEADLDAVVALAPVAVMVPKADDNPEFDRLLQRLMPSVPVIALVETASGLAGARSLAARPGVARLAFGSYDFCADLGCDHIEPALLGARTELVLASRLAGKPAPLDGVTAAINDPAAVEADSRYARALGFGGKLVIHPQQIAPVMAGFAPRQQEIEWAQKALASGDAAVLVDGAMVDAPIRARARALLVRAEQQQKGDTP